MTNITDFCVGRIFLCNWGLKFGDKNRTGGKYAKIYKVSNNCEEEEGDFQPRLLLCFCQVDLDTYQQQQERERERKNKNRVHLCFFFFFFLLLSAASVFKLSGNMIKN